MQSRFSFILDDLLFHINFVAGIEALK